MTRRSAWFLAAWSMTRWHRSGQSCISPSMLPSDVGRRASRAPLAPVRRRRYAAGTIREGSAGYQMNDLPGHRSFLVLAALAAALLSHSAAARDFYAGKAITFIVGSGVGGGYDLQA